MRSIGGAGKQKRSRGGAEGSRVLAEGVVGEAVEGIIEGAEEEHIGGEKGQCRRRGAVEEQRAGEKEQCRRRGEHRRSRGGAMEEHVGAEE
jgi:hypothetical protein